MKYTIQNIKVNPINMSKLNQSINDYLRKTAKIPDNVIYNAMGNNAIVKSPKQAIIDDEFVGGDISKEITWELYKTEIQSDGRKTHDCLPDRQVTISLTQMEQFLEPEITLAEFTKNANRNKSRIISNEQAWLNHFNK